MVHPLIVPTLNPIELIADEFKNSQNSCSSLEFIRGKASSGEVVTLRDGSSYSFIYDGGLLCRKCLSSLFSPNIGKITLVVPDKCRQTILEVSHESPVAGHFSHRKTEAKIGITSFGRRWVQMLEPTVGHVTDVNVSLPRAE